MDYQGLTSSSSTDGSPESLARAFRRLQDIEAIRNLVALYSIARDDNDLDRLVDFFAVHGSFVSGGARHTGHAELRTFYAGNMARYRTSLHVTHSNVIDWRGDSALGLVTGHAELAISGSLVVAAYRYDDSYVCHGAQWVFQERILRFMYAMPHDQLATGFDGADRMRWPGLTPSMAEIPETLTTFHEAREMMALGDWPPARD